MTLSAHAQEAHAAYASSNGVLVRAQMQVILPAAHSSPVPEVGQSSSSDATSSAGKSESADAMGPAVRPASGPLHAPLDALASAGSTRTCTFIMKPDGMREVSVSMAVALMKMLYGSSAIETDRRHLARPPQSACRTTKSPRLEGDAASGAPLSVALRPMTTTRSAP